MIGERLKHIFLGFNAYILSYRKESFDAIGLKHTRRFFLYNGALECEMREYEIFSGKRRERPKEEAGREHRKEHDYQADRNSKEGYRRSKRAEREGEGLNDFGRPARQERSGNSGERSGNREEWSERRGERSFNKERSPRERNNERERKSGGFRTDKEREQKGRPFDVRARIVGVPQGKITHRVNGRMVPVIRAVDLLLEKRTNQETSKKEHPPGQEILQMENAAGDHVPRRERNPGCVAPERENK